MPTPFRWEEGNTAIHDNREWIARSCVVLEPAHAEKQHAREPGDLLHVLVNRSRPVREGHKPSGGRARAGEVGLCRTTSEPAEQRRATFGGGWGGRAQTQENTVQSHMRPTQSGKRMSQGLRGVRQAARERKQERFTALLHHLSVGLLCDSFYALKRQASPGVDGVTWQEYETGLEDRLVDLHSRVHRGAYRARPSRRVYIPKADRRQRLLGIAAVEDKAFNRLW
jgi:hypothetical protein